MSIIIYEDKNLTSHSMNYRKFTHENRDKIKD